MSEHKSGGLTEGVIPPKDDISNYLPMDRRNFLKGCGIALGTLAIGGVSYFVINPALNPEKVDAVATGDLASYLKKGTFGGYDIVRTENPLYTVTGDNSTHLDRILEEDIAIAQVKNKDYSKNVGIAFDKEGNIITFADQGAKHGWGGIGYYVFKNGEGIDGLGGAPFVRDEVPGIENIYYGIIDAAKAVEQFGLIRDDGFIIGNGVDLKIEVLLK